MPKTSVELRQERAKLLADARAVNDRAEQENRGLAAEEQEQYDRHMAAMEELAGRIKRQEYLESTLADEERDGQAGRHDPEFRKWQLAQDQKSDPATAEEARAQAKRAYAGAFHQYVTTPRAGLMTPQTWETLHTGGSPLTEEERSAVMRVLGPDQARAMGISNLTLGGFWVPDEMMRQIEAALLWYGGMREVADVFSTDSGADLPWPVYDDTGNTGRLIAEGVAATQTDLTVGIRVMQAHMYSSDEILISIQLLQDLGDRVEGEIAKALGTRIGRITNTHFTSYDAPNGPQGLIRGTTLGVTAGATGGVTADEYLQLKYAVNRAYRDAPKAAFMAADATLRAAMSLKDAEGRYIYMPDPRVGVEPSLWGSRVVVNNDMPALATGNITVVFGDFDHYKIRDVKGFTLLRLEERYAPSLQVSFLGFSRHDGGLINAGQNPLQHLVQA